MTARFPPLSRMLRIALAVALSLSWLILSGLPAEAFVSNSYVEEPCPPEPPCADTTLKKARALVVVVERNPNPPGTGKETIRVLSDLFYRGLPTPPEPGPSEAPADDAGTRQDQDVSAQQQPAPEEPLNGKDNPVPLPFIKPIKNRGEPREFWRFGTAIDPHNLAWAGGAAAPNGQYVLRYETVSKVEGMEGSQERTWPDFEFRLDAPPASQDAPAVSTLDTTSKDMTVAWAHNRSPDVTSYTVERKLGDGEWRVARTGVKPSAKDFNSITETVPRYGTYRYRVTAFRPAGDGSGEARATTSPASEGLTLGPQAQEPPPDPDDDGDSSGDGDGDGTGGDGTSGDGDGDGDGSNPSFPSFPSNTDSGSNVPGFGTDTQPFTPGVAPPADFDDTFRGPLDFGVEPRSVTERVPVDIAQGGAGSDSTLQVLDRAIDQQRVLPPVAGGLILVVSAAHVLRYLNE